MQNKNIFIQGKTHFRLNEVCSITGVKPYVLRFWENEFSEIRATMSSTGEKHYSQKDLDIICLIKKLLFKDKLTIEKAKYELRLHPFMQDKTNDLNSVTQNQNISEELPAAVQELSEIDSNQPYYDLVKEKLKKIILKSETIEKGHNWFQA